MLSKHIGLKSSTDTVIREDMKLARVDSRNSKQSRLAVTAVPPQGVDQAPFDKKETPPIDGAPNSDVRHQRRSSWNLPNTGEDRNARRLSWDGSSPSSAVVVPINGRVTPPLKTSAPPPLITSAPPIHPTSPKTARIVPRNRLFEGQISSVLVSSHSVAPIVSIREESGIPRQEVSLKVELGSKGNTPKRLDKFDYMDKVDSSADGDEERSYHKIGASSNFLSQKKLIDAHNAQVLILPSKVSPSRGVYSYMCVYVM